MLNKLLFYLKYLTGSQTIVSLFKELPFDIKILILSYDEYIWIQFALVDNNIYEYSRKNTREIIKLFTKFSAGYNVQKWTIFGRLHRIDGPAWIKCIFYTSNDEFPVYDSCGCIYCDINSVCLCKTHNINNTVNNLIQEYDTTFFNINGGKIYRQYQLQWWHNDKRTKTMITSHDQTISF